MRTVKNVITIQCSTLTRDKVFYLANLLLVSMFLSMIIFCVSSWDKLHIHVFYITDYFQNITTDKIFFLIQIIRICIYSFFDIHNRTIRNVISLVVFYRLYLQYCSQTVREMHFSFLTEAICFLSHMSLHKKYNLDCSG